MVKNALKSKLNKSVKSKPRRQRQRRQPTVRIQRAIAGPANPGRNAATAHVSRLLAQSVAAQPGGMRLANPGGRASQRQTHVDKVPVVTDANGRAVILLRPGVFRGTYATADINAGTGAVSADQRTCDAVTFHDSALQAFVADSELYCSTGCSYKFVPNLAETVAPGFMQVETIASVARNGAPRTMSNCQLLNFTFEGSSQQSLRDPITGIVVPAGPDAIRFHSSQFYPLFNYPGGPNAGQPVNDLFTDRPVLPFGLATAGDAILDPSVTENAGERLSTFVNSLGFRSAVEGWDNVVFFIEGAPASTEVGTLHFSRAAELIGFGSDAPASAFAVDTAGARLDVGMRYDNGELGPKLATALSKAAPIAVTPGATTGIVKPEHADEIFDAISQVAEEHMAQQPQYLGPPKPKTAEHSSIGEALVNSTHLGSLVRSGAESLLPSWAAAGAEKLGIGRAVESLVDTSAAKAVDWAGSKLKSLFSW